LLLFIFLPANLALAADLPEEIKVDWQKTERVFHGENFASQRRNRIIDVSFAGINGANI
jgi:hypothetical protein